MEKMPYQPELAVEPVMPAATVVAEAPCTSDWRAGLPTLAGTLVTLRELRASDAPSLFAALTSDEVTRLISPPPPTVDGFERFIAWSHRQREAGQYAAFAVVARGSDTAIGLFQMRSLEAGFGTAEWGFAIASEFWGSGMFLDGAKLAIEFAFEVIGIRRLEARSAVRNVRGNGALRKLGAVREGVLRKSFLRHGEFMDQALWTILADEWRESATDWISPVIH
jgi:ribosomal-protein-alanine N-acetyltransferase